MLSVAVGRFRDAPISMRRRSGVGACYRVGQILRNSGCIEALPPLGLIVG